MDSPYSLNDPSALLSPSLLIFRPLVQRNLETMISMAGGPHRLRPHVKTHKMPEIVRMTERLGVRKHKVATIAEAEMVARAGGTDVLVSYPLVGPNPTRLARLLRQYPETTFRATVDHAEAARLLSAAVEGAGRPLPVLVDLEVGMGRTGIEPGDDAFELYAQLDRLPNLLPDGLHAYDGHLRQPALTERIDAANPGVEKTLKLRDRLIASGLPVPRLVLGGTPSFPVHARLDEAGLECSPGTSTLFDASYKSKFPDLPFIAAALLFSRVVSRPRPGRLCLDLGHKAVAADPQGDRVQLLDVPDATLGGQSEEHLVVETPHASHYPPGTPILAIPTHVCPTCALHRSAYVIDDGKVVEVWEVGARDRVITI